MIREKKTCSKSRFRTAFILPLLLFLSFTTPLQSQTEGVIVAFGDSLTAGLGVAADKAYPAQLAKKLNTNGYPYKVVNAGVSGETTAGGLRRIHWILKSQPDIVILALGANDGLRGLSLLEMEKNLSKIIQALQKEKIRIVLAGMKIPPNYGRRYTNGFEAIYSKLAERFDLTLIPFLLDGVAAIPTLNQADGIHPNARGYGIIVDRIWPTIKKVLTAE